MREGDARARPGSALRVTGRLALLAASMRAAGARVGVDELLGAHRALAAVDPADRSAAYFALRATLCSRRDDLAAFDAAFAELFAPPAQPAPELPDGARAGARSCCRGSAVPAEEVAVPDGGRGRRRARPPGPTPSCCATRTSPTTRTPSGALARRVMRRLAGARARRGRAAARGPPAAAARRRTPRAPTCAARCAPRCARRRPAGAPLARARRAPAPARARVRRVGLDGAVRADAAPVHAGVRGRAPARSRRSCSAPGSRASRRSCAGRDPDRALDRAAGARRRLVGRHAHRRRARDAQPRARPPARARRDRRAALGRLGPRRPRAARRRDGAPRPLRPQR